MSNLYIKTPAGICTQGFFALFLQVLEVLSRLKIDENEVVVDFRKNNFYLDKSRPGSNMWDYFFEQPSSYTLAEALETADFERRDFKEYCGVYGFKNGTHDWPPELLSEAREVCRKYIKVKRCVFDLTDRFYEENMKGKKILGIQKRGTNYWTVGHGRGKNIPLEHYFKSVDDKLFQFDNIFLVTDELKTLEEFRKKYGKALIHYDEAKLDDGTQDIPLYLRDKSDGHKFGEDVLIEGVLLSRVDYLLAVTSNISQFAKIYNPTLQFEHIDKHIKYKD